jgi:tetraacyldisaccharide 4'-kinase
MRHKDRRSRPPLPAWFGGLGEPVYRWAVARRNARFDRGEGIKRFPMPVISVGNLSVGGTGKTPIVALVVRKLIETGRRPAVVMRGYKRRAGKMSDEQAEYAAIFGDAVPVEADPDRCGAIARLIGRAACDCVVLDDGFQHRRVARDLDIVLIDATRDAFADRLLPRGWLREPVGSLARAGAVVMTHADGVRDTDRKRVWAQVRAITGTAVQVEAVHAWAGLSVFENGAERAEPVSWIEGRHATVACGIGNPAAFSAQARSTGCEVTREVFMPDHHHWRAHDLAEVVGDAAKHSGPGGVACVVTTMKDWVKLREVPGSRAVVWVVPRLEVRLTSGAEPFAAAILHPLRAAQTQPAEA